MKPWHIAKLPLSSKLSNNQLKQRAVEKRETPPPLVQNFVLEYRGSVTLNIQRSKEILCEFLYNTPAEVLGSVHPVLSVLSDRTRFHQLTLLLSDQQIMDMMKVLFKQKEYRDTDQINALHDSEWSELVWPEEVLQGAASLLKKCTKQLDEIHASFKKEDAEREERARERTAAHKTVKELQLKEELEALGYKVIPPAAKAKTAVAVAATKGPKARKVATPFVS